MVHKQTKCRGCGKVFFTKQIKVYVFKERICSNPECKTVMNIKGNLCICTKCGLTINKLTNPIAYAKLGVAMKGTSRNIIEAEKHRQKGTEEVEKVFVDEADLCQACQNFLTRRMQAMHNNEKNGPQIKLSSQTKEEQIEEIQKAINRKIGLDKQAEEKLKAEAEMKRLDDAKAKVVEEVSKATE